MLAALVAITILWDKNVVLLFCHTHISGLLHCQDLFGMASHTSRSELVYQVVVKVVAVVRQPPVWVAAIRQ